MEEKNNIEKLLSNVKEYAEVRFDLVSLNFQDKLSVVVSSIVSIVIIAVLSLLIFLFASIGAALWLGEYFQNNAIGFFCVMGFYIFLTFLLLVNREKWIKFPIMNSLIKKMNFNDEN